MKKNVWPFKIWLGPLLFIKILLKTAELLSQHFLSGLSPFASFISFSIKGRILLEFLNQAFSILYIFSHFLHFHKCFNNFHLSKNIFINKFFHWNVFLYSFNSMKQEICQFLIEVKYHAIKNETFPFYSHWLLKDYFQCNKKWAITPVQLEIILCKSENKLILLVRTTL